MSSNEPRHKRDFAYWVRKYLISAFVVASFAGYVIHERGNDQGNASTALPTRASSPAGAPVTTIYPTRVSDTPTPVTAPTDNSQAPAAAPSATPQVSLPTDTAAPVDPTSTPVPPTAAPTAVANKSGLKDGEYTGDVADAFYGGVQVKAIIKNGKITDVQFVQYPNDRRTSVRINSQAMPWLQQEAIDAQSAQVDIISGATLTSQAFIESLQVALDSAKS